MDTTSVKVSQQITDSTAVRLRFPYDLRLKGTTVRLFKCLT